MRVLLINCMETTAAGGINKTVREVGINLATKGHDVTVIQTNPLSLPHEEVHEGLKIIRIPGGWGQRFFDFNPGMYCHLIKHINKLNPEIVHIHGYHTLFSPEAGFFIKKINPGIPVVFSFHLDAFRSTFVGKYFFWLHNSLLGRQIAKNADKIVAFSAFEKGLIENWLKANSSNISIIPHGVNIIDPVRRPKNSNTLNLLYVGYLIKRKGIQYILYSLHELVHRLETKDVRLTIVGEGPEQQNLQKLANQLNVTDHVTWIPRLPGQELTSIIKNSDLLLLLSESEAYGIIVAESLALGTPVLVTRNTALQEFENEPGCFCVDYPPDPNIVASVISKMDDSKIRVDTFTKKIRTWDKVAEDYENLYKKTLACH